jgi:exodeoxyribonuclease V alpha subunit
MHGGMKTFRGSPASARNYVEADRSRADDYYLAEGTRVAERYVASPDTEVGNVLVRRLSPLSGDGYEAWVAGVDPDTGVARGRLRNDDHAVRFVEVIVNGPKSWSLAAALHADVSAAYDAAQDRAAEQIIGWLAQHATVRVGGRGQQVQVPVEQIEAATVRHYTSRAGDPHRHLHLQINARVFAAGQWRGLHTVGVRDSLAAINGIGHAAVMTDPHFRAVLAAHGYGVDTAGEIAQLAPHVGAFSQRAAQIERNIQRYESEWTAAHPDETAGPALRRAWDARAWADGRPDKVIPQSGAELRARWLTELADLGYRDRDKPVDLTPTPVGALDRDQAVELVVARLAAGKSAWNAPDIRGEVEQHIASEGVVVDAQVRAELAEDLTARVLERCVPLLHREGVPEHIRASTSAHVLDVEADIVGRLAVRGAEPGHDIDPSRVARAGEMTGRQLDAGQSAVVAVLAGGRSLVVVEGAAGAGKTTFLAAARDLLAAQGGRLTVVTPTLKAAKVAQAELGAPAGSAARLVHQHGWRWDTDGRWSRLTPGDVDPVTGRVYVVPDVAPGLVGTSGGATLRAGDLLVVDEAGMLDQDTARALFTIADEHHVRIALLGDRHQLSAVGRGGVLDLAARWADPDACLTLDVVHRFNLDVVNVDGTTRTVADVEYADLTVAMRSGNDPGSVFDALLARGQIQLYPSVADLQAGLAETAAARYATRNARTGGEQVAVVVDTREQAAALNAAIRDRLVAAEQVDDTHAITTTGAGQRIGVGDRIATRRNDRDLDVANRDTWTVTAVDRYGQLTVTNVDAGQRQLPADYVQRSVELAYATTAHGVQGDTVTAAHLIVGEQTGATSAYVGMTRGRASNIAHLVSENADDAREQWTAVFARDRADLGPAHAAEQAAREAANYAQPRPLDHVLAELHNAWEREARCLERLEWDEPRRDALREIAVLRRDQPAELAAIQDKSRHARTMHDQTTSQLQHCEARIASYAERYGDQLLAEWDADRDPVRHAAGVVKRGPGPLGIRLPAVNRAREELGRWSVKWQPYLPDMPTTNDRVVHYAAGFDYQPRIRAAFTDHAHQAALDAHPERREFAAAAEHAGRELTAAWGDLGETLHRHASQLDHYGSLAHTDDPDAHLARLERDVATTRGDLDTARQQIGQLTTDPAVRALPAGRLAHEHDRWRASYDSQRELENKEARLAAIRADHARRPRLDAERGHQHQIDLGRDSGRDGPSIGR